MKYQTKAGIFKMLYYLFIGTYSPANTNGIHIYTFDVETGKQAFISSVNGIENPTFLTVSPDHKFIYATSTISGKTGGTIHAYSFDAQSGTLKFINKQYSKGDHPCHLTIDKTGRWLIVSNFSGAIFPYSLLKKTVAWAMRLKQFTIIQEVIAPDFLKFINQLLLKTTSSYL